MFLVVHHSWMKVEAAPENKTETKNRRWIWTLIKKLCWLLKEFNLKFEKTKKIIIEKHKKAKNIKVFDKVSQC